MFISNEGPEIIVPPGSSGRIQASKALAPEKLLSITATSSSPSKSKVVQSVKTGVTGIETGGHAGFSIGRPRKSTTE